MGLKKWQTEKSIVEEIMDLGYPDEFFQVSEEEARNMANILCQEEGIYCGMSSGANVFIALKIAERAEILDGAGGGDAKFAQGGGKDTSKMNDAIAKAKSMILG